MRVILCDRCGARIEREDTVGFVGLTRKDINTGNLIGKTDFEDWDICDDCMKQIEEFVRINPAKQELARKVAHEVAQEYSGATEPAPVEITELSEDYIIKPKAIIKKPMPARITPEQIDQIKAMVAEGMAVKDIAETVGVSGPTVRKYKKELEDETMDGEE